MWEFLPAVLTVAGSLLGAKGNIDSANAAVDTSQEQADLFKTKGDYAVTVGDQQYAAAKFAAAQLRQNAGQAVAASQRTAQANEHETALIQSRALALAAASGGGAQSADIVSMMGKTASESALRSATALYNGEEQARQMKMAATAQEYQGYLQQQAGLMEQQLNYKQANIALKTGANKRSAYTTAAVGSLITGASSLFTKYGGSNGFDISKTFGGLLDN